MPDAKEIAASCRERAAFELALADTLDPPKPKRQYRRRKQRAKLDRDHGNGRTPAVTDGSGRPLELPLGTAVHPPSPGESRELAESLVHREA
jgi:hypothetical protein